MSDIRNIILGRMPSRDVPRIVATRKAAERVLDAHDALRTMHAAAADNKKLSPLGRLDEMRDFVAKRTAPAIHHGRSTATSARADLAKWRTRLQPPKPDTKDVAAAVLRSEMRTMLRGMSHAARASHIFTDNPDPTLIQAILEAPDFSSGINSEMRERVVEQYVNQHHPADLAAIAEAEQALTLLDAATDHVFVTARALVEFPSERVFADFIEANKPNVRADTGSGDNLHLLDGLVPPAGETSDEVHARILAEARADLAAAGLV